VNKLTEFYALRILIVLIQFMWYALGGGTSTAECPAGWLYLAEHYWQD